MTDREAWVRFACAAIADNQQNGTAAKLADAMLAELNKRKLDDGPLVVMLDPDTTQSIEVELCSVHSTKEAPLRVLVTEE